MAKEYSIEQGECLSSLAKRFGFHDYRRIYEHPNNSELKKMRPNPNVIYPDDVVFIPDQELKQVDAATEQRHVFELIQQKTRFRLVVKDSDEQPFANVNYLLQIDRQNFEGVTDADGKLEELIPAEARFGKLLLFAEEAGEEKTIAVLSLKLGHLDPVEEMTGVQSRLNNLGFGCGKVDGIPGKKTSAALRAFQEKNDLPETGEADEATREKLRQLHDWE